MDHDAVTWHLHDSFLCARRGVVPRAIASDTGLLRVHVCKSWEAVAEHLTATRSEFLA